MKILTLIDHYLPGWKAGGPTQSIAALISTLPSDFEFWVVTRDRDHRDRCPYDGITPKRWVELGKAKVLYLPPLFENVWVIAQAARVARPDVIYLNGLFSRLTLWCLVARKLRLVPNVPVILAPRGEMATSALKLKAYKKRPFLWIARGLGLFKGICWQASSGAEKADILSQFSGPTRVAVSPNVVIAADIAESGFEGSDVLVAPPKDPGAVQFLFLARISRMKNLDFLLRALSHVRGNASLDIIGPIDDSRYWKECQEIIKHLPENICVEYRGAVPHSKVAAAMSARHFLVLPTRGENFGHVIYEALVAGCPVVLSDTTIWTGVAAAGGGWAIPLGKEGAWQAALQECVDMGPARYGEMASASRAFGAAAAAKQESVRVNIEMFRRVVKGGN